MATALTAREQELVDALRSALEAMDPDDAEFHAERYWVDVVLAHTLYEPHCCWGNCDFDKCDPEWRGRELG